MIGGVVLDQINPMSAAIELGHHYLVQIAEVRSRVEVLRLMPPNKPSGGDGDCPKDFLSIALTLGGNFGLMTAPCPSAVEGGRLAKRGFVGISD